MRVGERMTLRMKSCAELWRKANGRCDCESAAYYTSTDIFYILHIY